jgi:hypothetical protein
MSSSEDSADYPQQASTLPVATANP